MGMSDRYGCNDDHRHVAGACDYHRRGDERLFEAPVTSVRAVVGPPEERCWIDRDQYRGDTKVPGAIAGAVIGGILGHPDRWRERPGRGDCRRRGSRCSGGRERRPRRLRVRWRGATVQDRRTLRSSRLLGRHVLVPWRGAPCGDDGASGQYDHPQPRRRAARLTPTSASHGSGPSGPLPFCAVTCSGNAVRRRLPAAPSECSGAGP